MWIVILFAQPLTFYSASEYYCTSSCLVEHHEIDRKEIISPILQQRWYFQSKRQNEN